MKLVLQSCHAMIGVQYWFAVTSLLSTLPDAIRAFVSLSRHSTQVAFHFNFDPIAGKTITTGVLFRTAFKDITLQGASDSDCYIAVGDIRGFDRAVFENPQLCTHFAIFPRPTDEETVAEGGLALPQGISVGMQADRGLIATLDFYGEYADLTQTNPYNLPLRTFPVAVTGDSEGGVYVGLHGTGGIRPPPAPDNADDELRNIYEYYTLMNHPMKTEHVISPSVLKVNMKTREPVWEVQFNTTEGRSTIASVIHIASRDLLVVAGSSNGKGSYVGAGAWSNSWDGYITLVNATSGEVDDSAANQTHLAAEHSLRIQSQVGMDDYILGMCASDDTVYLVGATTGKMATDENMAESSQGGGFIMLLDVDTLNIKWTQQWHGLGVEAIKCSASSTFIYVAGHVPVGVSLAEDDTRVQSPARDQDLFVALVNIDGSIEWTRQIDSRRTDHLANIVQTAYLDMLLVGNSLDFEKGVSDIYTFSVAKADGFYDWQGLPPDADPIRGGSSGGAQEAPSSSSGDQADNDNRSTVIAVSVVVPCVVLIAVALFAFASKKKAANANQDKESRDTVPEQSGEKTSANVADVASSEPQGGVV